jgi:hypothetical protein
VKNVWDEEQYQDTGCNLGFCRWTEGPKPYSPANCNARRLANSSRASDDYKPPLITAHGSPERCLGRLMQ